MFSTLLGALPPLAADDPDRGDGVLGAVRRNVADLEAAGLELLTDGLAAATPDEDPDAVVARWRAAADATTRPVKQVLLGPASGGPSGAAPAPARSPAEAAARTRAVLEALGAAGCPFVEIAEPAASSIVSDAGARAAFVAAHAALLDGVAGIHVSLALTGANFDAAGAATFFDLPYASYAFDLIAGPDNWRLITAAPGDRGIVCGALDPRPDGDETRELLVWAAHYAASTSGRGIARVGLANASSLEDLPREVALRKLDRVADGARVAAVGSAEEMAALLDPRALGLRRPGRPAHGIAPAGDDPSGRG
jgi:methionine synthase II (cobalamin-independent)